YYGKIFIFFFFQAEDGIRDKLVTGVQTCALPISLLRQLAARGGQEVVAAEQHRAQRGEEPATVLLKPGQEALHTEHADLGAEMRSEERRVGKECRYRWAP